MFRAEYQARPKLVWERRPWNVRRSSKPFLNGRPPLGQVCCISNLLYSWSICMVSLGRPSWTSLELGDLSCTIKVGLYLLLGRRIVVPSLKVSFVPKGNRFTFRLCGLFFWGLGNRFFLSL